MPSEYRATALRAVRGAGFARRRRISTLDLAEALLGEGAVRTVTEVEGVPPPFAGAICWLSNRGWRVYLSSHPPMPVRNFVLCHELSHYLLGPAASEEECDALAIELLARCWGRNSTRYQTAIAEYGPRFERRSELLQEAAL